MKSAASSARAKRLRMKGRLMKTAHSRPLTASQKKELAALARMRDEEIDTRSIPVAKNWSGAKRGVLRRDVTPD
jgi:uncharacterized protein (DUF4415 family)